MKIPHIISVTLLCMLLLMSVSVYKIYNLMHLTCHGIISLNEDEIGIRIGENLPRFQK